MSKKLDDDRARLVIDLEARSHFLELISAQLLLRLAILYENPHGFIENTLDNIQIDLLRTGGESLDDESSSAMTATTLDYFKMFRASLKPAMDSIPKVEMN